MVLKQIAPTKWINPDAVTRAELFIGSDEGPKLEVKFGSEVETYTIPDEIQKVAEHLQVWDSIRTQINKAAYNKKLMDSTQGDAS